MQVQTFFDIIGADFYAGVPDSQLRSLCDFLMKTYGINSKHHIIAANEGNCVALAAGYHLATGKVPVVYMQNSGEGNIINPVVSLLNNKVYGIPVVFVIGWRGEPGRHDEPQHIYQGEITIKLLEDMGICSFVVEKNTTSDELRNIMKKFNSILAEGKDVAFVIKKEALIYEEKIEYKNDFLMKREDVIRHIVNVSDKDPIVSTTGKASRELFEIREERRQSHELDFLTIGSMGHASSIALELATQKEDTKIWCIDGDGAVLMHMGAMAVIGTNKPANLIHIIINNNAHETVGGMPTVANSISFTAIAKACGYPYAVCVDSFERLDYELAKVKECKFLCLIEVKCLIGSRNNLGRPTITANENKNIFMEYIREKC